MSTIYVYVYPVEGFDRNIADERLTEAFLEKSGVQRYTLERFIEALNDDEINLNTQWVRKIEDSEGCYPISSLHVNDLEESGYDLQKLSESDLLTLADKLNDDYRKFLYWNSLVIIADGMCFPQREKRIICLEDSVPHGSDYNHDF